MLSLAGLLHPAYPDLAVALDSKSNASSCLAASCVAEALAAKDPRYNNDAYAANSAAATACLAQVQQGATSYANGAQGV